MAARTKARKRALDVLYAAELRGRSVAEELAEHRASVEQVNPYTIELVTGVDAHRARLDEVIASYAQGWSLQRMPALDRNLLRLGAFEILEVGDVPDAVAISEAVGLARDLSTDASPTFVNGLLARIEALKPTMAL